MPGFTPILKRYSPAIAGGLCLSALPPLAAQAAPAPPNLALHKPFVCSDPNLSGYLGLTDGSWSNDYPHVFASGKVGTFPKTVTTDLGKPSVLKTVLLGVPPFGATKTIQVALSLGKTTGYKVVGSYQFRANHAERHAFSISPAVKARYVRLIYPDHWDNGGGYEPVHVFTSELEVYDRTVATPPARIRVSCVGDSITQGVFVSEAQRWTNVLQADLGDRYDVENYGVSGRTLIKKGDAPYWTEPAFGQATALLPNIVIIMLGTNDSKPQNLPSHPGEFAPDLRALVSQFTALSSHPKVWLVLPPPVFANGLAGISEGVLASAVRPVVRQVAREEGCGLIDLAPVLASHPEDSLDHVHPNAAGHKLIGDAVAQVIGKTSL